MQSITNRWDKLEPTLKQLGLSNEGSWRIKRIREKYITLTSISFGPLPDFTLYSVDHCDNLILILGMLQSKFGFVLGQYEAYLLAASVYLHDVGIFFDKTRFEQEILPNFKELLKLCPQDMCDPIKAYNMASLTLNQKIWSVYHLLSAYLLLHDDPSLFGVDSKDRPFLITICRGHRNADLAETTCGCYKTRPVEEEFIRVGLLASLLRLSDQLDFYPNRAPEIAFRSRANTFLSDPSSLERWVKHYFISDPYISKRDESGNIVLDCTLNFVVPMKRINGYSYLDFFRPIFHKHILDASQSVLNIRRFSSDFTKSLGVAQIRLTLAEEERVGFVDLPIEISTAVAASGTSTFGEFLVWRSNFVVQLPHTNVKGMKHAANPEGSTDPEPATIFNLYKNGLTLLLQKLHQEDPRYASILVYQQRLLEILEKVERYGDTDAHKSERAEIIDRLNEIALTALGTSFNELCDLIASSKAPIDNSGRAQSEFYQVPLPEGTLDALNALTAPHAKRMLEIYDIETLAVDDCIVLAHSWEFQGWTDEDIQISVLESPVELPEELQSVVKADLPRLQQHYYNTIVYRLYSFRPQLLDYRKLRITFAPTDYYTFFAIFSAFDRPVLDQADGSKVTIREKYEKMLMSFGSNSNVISPLPAVMAVHVLVISSDEEFLLFRRSQSLGFYPGAWTCSFEETMSIKDISICEAVIRGISEELGSGLRVSLKDIRILSLNYESDHFAANTTCIARIHNSTEEIRRSWLLSAHDKAEADRLVGVPFTIDQGVMELLSAKQWHPTARIRLLQGLFHKFGLQPTLQVLASKLR